MATKSTSIAELQSQNEATSTKPLVQDILHEIQQEQEKSGEGYELPGPPPGGDGNTGQNIPTELEDPQMEDQNDPNQYAQQQQQALQHQIDPNVNRPMEGGPSPHQQEPPANTEHMPEHFSNQTSQSAGPDLQDLNLEANQNGVYNDGASRQKSISQRIFIEARDPLLVLLLSILLSVPIVQASLLKFISKIPGSQRIMVPIVIKAVLMAVLFYGIRKLF